MKKLAISITAAALSIVAVPLVALSFTSTASAAAEAGTLKGKVTVNGAKHNGNAVVYLEKIDAEGAQRGRKKHKMWQKEKQFSPQVLIVQKGDEVEFPNGDKLFHNVFSVSKPARFDLGLYKEGESKNVKFKRTGVVDVYCNIHPQMVGKVLVVPNRFYFHTKKDGAFEIDGVPPGEYKLYAWHPKGKEVVENVTVTAGKATDVAFSLKASKSGTHVRKDGTPYGRYK